MPDLPYLSPLTKSSTICTPVFQVNLKLHLHQSYRWRLPRSRGRPQQLPPARASVKFQRKTLSVPNEKSCIYNSSKISCVAPRFNSVAEKAQKNLVFAFFFLTFMAWRRLLRQPFDEMPKLLLFFQKYRPPRHQRYYLYH